MPNTETKDYIKVLEAIKESNKIQSTISSISSLKNSANKLLENFIALKKDIEEKARQMEEAKPIVEEPAPEKPVEKKEEIKEVIKEEPKQEVKKEEPVVKEEPKKVEPIKEEVKPEPPKQPKIEKTDNPNIVIIDGVKTWVGDVKSTPSYKQQKQERKAQQQMNNGIKVGKDVFVPVNSQNKKPGAPNGQRPFVQGQQQNNNRPAPVMPQPLPPKGKGKMIGNGKSLKQSYDEDENKAVTADKKSKNTGVTITRTYDEYGNEYEVIKSKKNKGDKNANKIQTVVIENAVITTDPVSIKTLSEKIGKTAAQIVATLFKLDIFKNINDSIDFATAELVAGEYGIVLEYKPEITKEEKLNTLLENDEIDDLDKLVPRAPVVTIMGHVDHGKSSLLDNIRVNYLNLDKKKTTNFITAKEAGGITQKIGAYTISIQGQKITFLDTPGHEAFTAMRLRGAMVADIAILVVAADDGIMPQTIESISHVKQANIPIIVAVNKIDKLTANPDIVLSQLTEHGITPEQWGGETPVVKVSAKVGTGIEELLEQILVRAEFQELKANPDRKAKGTILEAKQDAQVGKIATVLVQNGTLHVGDYVVAGTCTGKIRTMTDDKGKQVKKAGPSTAVAVTGWDDIPNAGDNLVVVDNAKFSKELAEERRLKAEAAKNSSTSVSLNDLFAKAAAGELKSVKLIIKADDQGSVEAVKTSLAKIQNEEVKIDIVHDAVGGIKESDVQLAETSGAIIIGFNVRPDKNASDLAKQDKVDIRYYDIIYDIIDDITNAVKGLVAPKFQDVVIGSAEIRNLIRVPNVGVIAGCRVIEGRITRDSKVRIIRNGKVEYTSEISSLKHLKDDVKEMKEGYECGLTVLNYRDYKEGDILEAFLTEQIKDEN